MNTYPFSLYQQCTWIQVCRFSQLIIMLEIFLDQNCVCSFGMFQNSTHSFDLETSLEKCTWITKGHFLTTKPTPSQLKPLSFTPGLRFYNETIFTFPPFFILRQKTPCIILQKWPAPCSLIKESENAPRGNKI